MLVEGKLAGKYQGGCPIFRLKISSNFNNVFLVNYLIFVDRTFCEYAALFLLKILLYIEKI